MNNFALIKFFSFQIWNTFWKNLSGAIFKFTHRQNLLDLRKLFCCMNQDLWLNQTDSLVELTQN